jgi:hypothetical protein
VIIFIALLLFETTYAQNEVTHPLIARQIPPKFETVGSGIDEAISGLLHLPGGS